MLKNSKFVVDNTVFMSQNHQIKAEMYIAFKLILAAILWLWFVSNNEMVWNALSLEQIHAVLMETGLQQEIDATIFKTLLFFLAVLLNWFPVYELHFICIFSAIRRLIKFYLDGIKSDFTDGIIH